ncbi:hypothetical protein CH75_06480 [Dyella jiangningensis]|nr:hypothetical protein CH75_06480 [Dyella jiangningensis]
MTAYLYRMPSGIPGMVSREENKTIETVPFDSTAPFSAFGLFGKIVSGKLQPVGAGDVATAIYGLLVKPFPANSSQEGLGTAVPPTSGPANVLRRGYTTVQLNAGTAALNGTVYVRVATPGSGKPIGGIEAAADSTNTIVVANCTFMGAADASGNVEIAYNI